MERWNRKGLWVTLGVVLPLLMAGLFYVTLPQDDYVVEGTAVVDEKDYSETVYGKPGLDVEGYAFSEDSYFEYVMDGYSNIGKEDPTLNSLWYNYVIVNPELLTRNDDMRGILESVEENGSFKMEDIKNCVTSNRCVDKGQDGNEEELVDFDITLDALEGSRTSDGKDSESEEEVKEEEVEGEDTEEEGKEEVEEKGSEDVEEKEEKGIEKCTVKGFVDETSKEDVYVLDTHDQYTEVVGTETFCSEKEAKEAGYSKLD